MELLKEQPHITQTLGNLGLQSEEAWIELMAGGNLFVAETTRRHLRQLRAELAGPDASALERMLVDLAAACWLQVQYAELNAAKELQKGVPAQHRRELERQREGGQKRFQASLKQLAQTRSLLASAAKQSKTPARKSKSKAPVECGAGSSESVFAIPRLSREQEADALTNGVGVAN